MSHLILVHGSYQGAWCWERISPVLKAAGHRVTGVELPVGNPTYGASQYADAVIEQADWTEPPILIGHSMAGLVIPIVAARAPVRQLVFLAAMLPLPGKSANDQRAAEPIDGTTPPATAEWTDLGDGVWMVGPNTASELFFSDATLEDAAWASSHLRPQSYRIMSEVTPLDAWPLVPIASIVCRADRSMNPDWCRTAARTRLGIEPVEIDGGHSPFLTRPGELASLLESLLV
jgi:pimeloyl-ACP methyl ester carboxylesterase